MSRRPSPLEAVGLALLALVAGGLVRVLMGRLVGGSLPFLTFFPAILIVTVLEGRIAAIVTVLGGVILGALVLTPSVGNLPPFESRVFAALLMTVFGGFIAYVALMLREALRDLEARREQEEILLLEVQHRVKNSLAVVQSIAAQTLGKEHSPAAQKFMDRLVALGEVHNLLGDSGWRPVSLRSLAEGALEPFRPALPQRVVVAGEDLQLAPDTAVTIGLALHELATNAVKYGALSDDVGRVELWWAVLELEGRRVLRITWTEKGGPPVMTPTRVGFGSRLLRRRLGGSGRNEARLDFLPEGVTWSLDLDLDEAAGVLAPHGTAPDRAAPPVQPATLKDL